MHFPFSKYHGLGNDFILIDDRQESFATEDSSLISRLCRRRTGIGADGLILLQNSLQADYWMRIFNADGKEVAMCGNGLRCLMAFLRALGLAHSTNSILAGGKLYKCSFEGEEVSVQMGRAEKVSWNVNLSLEGKEMTAHFIHIGVPHAVVFVDDVNQIAVEELGREIRWHPLFQPQGVNVNFVSELAPSALQMRVYERGVEAETLACGTGAAAAALAACRMLGCVSPIKMIMSSKEELNIRLSRDEEIEMVGGATFVFKGHFSQKEVQCITV